MVSLKEIVPSYKTVKTSFGEVSVTGLGLDGIAHLLKNHPQIADMIQKGGIVIGQDGFSFAQVVDLGLDVVSSFLAAGLGYPGDEDAISKCRKFTPEDAWNLGEAILKESFPSGPSSFFQKIAPALAMQIAPATESNPS